MGITVCLHLIQRFAGKVAQYVIYRIHVRQMTFCQFMIMTLEITVRPVVIQLITGAFPKKEEAKATRHDFIHPVLFSLTFSGIRQAGK